MLRVLLLCLFVSLPLSAQDELTVPETWKVRADRGTATVVDTPERSDPRSEVYLVTMPPGWHITTGPAIITWDPAWQATGSYQVEAEIFLFPGDRAEGFGLFVGGSNLEGANQAYLYVLLRKDGKYLVKRRAGADTETLVDWTAHEAIVPHTGQDGTAKNVLALNVGDDEIRVMVNGETLRTLPRGDIITDGQAGLRVNHALNLHVGRFEISTGG
jgi:hypothetical protein